MCLSVFEVLSTYRRCLLRKISRLWDYVDVEEDKLDGQNVSLKETINSSLIAKRV